jgi:DNA-binding NarL/FixJ family response regulator
VDGNDLESPGADSRDRARLTVAEWSVLRLLAEGRNNDEIAAALGKSRGTVKHQVSSVLHKLVLRDRVAAVVWWYTVPPRAREVSASGRKK